MYWVGEFLEFRIGSGDICLYLCYIVRIGHVLAFVFEFVCYVIRVWTQQIGCYQYVIKMTKYDSLQEFQGL
jgi:hypothetical protein